MTGGGTPEDVSRQTSVRSGEQTDGRKRPGHDLNHRIRSKVYRQIALGRSVTADLSLFNASPKKLAIAEGDEKSGGERPQGAVTMIAFAPHLYCDCGARVEPKRIAVTCEGHRFVSGFCQACRNLCVRPFPSRPAGLPPTNWSQHEHARALNSLHD